MPQRAQRAREIGIRSALGARAAQLWWLVGRIAAWGTIADIEGRVAEINVAIGAAA